MRKKLVIIPLVLIVIASILRFDPILLDPIEHSFLYMESADNMEEARKESSLAEFSEYRSNQEWVRYGGASDAFFGPLINEIQGYLDDKEGTYGISFLDITTGAGFGINDDRTLIAASTVKVPINLYLHNLIAQKKINPKKMLTYTEDYYEEGTGVILDEEFGKKYSVRELSRLSIENSDNIAINMLIQYLGRNNILKYMESVVKHPVDKEKNVSTPKDMTIYLKAILDFNQKYPQQGAELIDYLEKTVFNDRIPLYLPESVPVAHKIGTQVHAIHDVGIVFAEKPYILSIMSEGVDEDQAPEIIGQVSRMIYDFSQQ